MKGQETVLHAIKAARPGTETVWIAHKDEPVSSERPVNDPAWTTIAKRSMRVVRKWYEPEDCLCITWEDNKED